MVPAVYESRLVSQVPCLSHRAQLSSRQWMEKGALRLMAGLQKPYFSIPTHNQEHAM